MTDQEVQGTIWGAGELDSIIVDYFAMLGEELAQRPIVKAHHREILMRQTGRSAGSIERKHQNISAVLMELGLPWIRGYKPLSNYQDALFEAIDRYLSARQDILYVQLENPALLAEEPAAVFNNAPPPVDRSRRDNLDRLIRKFDPVERDFRNRQLGNAGEGFVVDVERKRLAANGREDLAQKVRWVSQENGDGAGFDVLSHDLAGNELLIEVKTTNGAAQTPFFLTRNEFAVSQERPDHWQLYRVHLFAQTPRIFIVRPPLENALKLDAETWRAAPR